MHKACEKKVLLALIISLVGSFGISVTLSPKLLSAKIPGCCGSGISNSADARATEPRAASLFGNSAQLLHESEFKLTCWLSLNVAGYLVF